jgi:arylsulfatase A-like enzyme
MILIRASLTFALLLTLATGLAARGRPNVLWLTVEDMSPWIACYGDETVSTPNLDRLASTAVRYANAFATSPVCAPARSSLITGMYATRIGTLHMRAGKPSRAALERDPEAYAQIPSYEGVPPAHVRCFPELLRAAGYYCSNASKTDYQFEAPATVWDASGPRAHWRDRAPGQPFFAVFNYAGTHESCAFPSKRRKPSVVAPRDVPVPPLYPDTPAVREALARTYDNIAAMDAWIGARLAELEEAKLTESTVVFFFSDHGVGLPRGKRSPYDLGTRVPLLVRIPGAPGAGTAEARVVSFVDFGPSVLSLAGIEPDERLDGTPFLGPHARPGHGFAFAHADRFDTVYDRARSVSDGRYRLVRNLLTDIPHLLPNAYRELLPMTRDLHALRDAEQVPPEHWQVASTERPREELYDSSHDPWEVCNLIDSPRHAHVAARLRDELDRWIAETGDLGLVLPEERMVAERLWPGGIQPRTAMPSLAIEDERVRIACETPGASLGYREGEEGPWTVYTAPFEAGDAASLELLAHRIGFAPARTRVALR